MSGKPGRPLSLEEALSMLNAAFDTSIEDVPAVGLTPYIESDEKIEALWWRNLYFDKSGKVYRGDALHPSEDVARRAGNLKLRDSFARENIDILRFKIDGDLPKENYSHFIPVPWLKK